MIQFITRETLCVSLRRRSLPWAKNGLSLLMAIACLTACQKKSDEGFPGGGGAKMPPTEVSVVTVALETVSMTSELPGRVNAVRDAEVRARVSGVLLKRYFEEGADIQEGDLLFQIDPAPLQASYDSAKAALARAQATLKQAKAKAQRYQALVKINAISQQDDLDASTTQAQAEADVLTAQAALETASLNLGYTKVTAPISGRIGKANVTEGALVSASEATQLAVIRQLDPIYVDFNQSSADVMKLRRMIDSSKLLKIAPGQAKVTLVQEDGTVYSRQGQLLFSDISVNESTGSLVLRTQFPNPEKWLLPGMFVRGLIDEAINEKAITVPQRAVTRGSDGEASVQIVNNQNQVESRAIKVSNTQGDKWIVTDGLKAGERVIVEGAQKVHAGSTVVCVPFGSTNTPSTQP